MDFYTIGAIGGCLYLAQGLVQLIPVLIFVVAKFGDYLLNQVLKTK